ncbi:MAG TPA: histidine kinase [Casimicrobiaceae bacterium]|jgi:signal transduction histidine kinase|nr:histidine kinase [Casimicrobiaceae bacterium]
MTTSTTSQGSVASAPWWALFLAGLRCSSWRTVGLILAINTAVAILLFTEETRPFWHPFITAQCVGLSIAYAVNAAQPWESAHPLRRLLVAVVGGTVVGMLLLLVIKGYIIGDPEYRMGSLHGHASPGMVVGTGISALVLGLCVSLFFLLKIRDALSRAAMLKAEAERNLLSKQAVEAELKLMQAQVEPHFLFNTLASVQFLTETDPPKAGMMLGHLLAYLRAALPQLRSDSTTLAQETELAGAYLSIMQMRMGRRLSFVIDVPPQLAAHRFPPMLLMSVVENAIKHGLEPQAAGGTIRVEARREGGRLIVTVNDDGSGLGEKLGNGVGLTNLRDRLRALYADRARFTLEENFPHGARATIEIPYDEEH